MNLFTTDKIQAGKVSSATSNIGEIVSRNGVNSYRIGPSPFWSGDGATSNNISKGLFKSNVSYIFDLWIDADDVWYDGISNNVPAGLTCRYTDGSGDNIVATGNRNTPKGFQHIVFESNASKTISGLGVYYYVGTPAYYRIDSSITPKSNNLSINKQGIFKSECFTTFNTTVSISSGDTVKTNNLIEY